MTDQINVTELSEILITALVNNPEASERLSTCLGGRRKTAVGSGRVTQDQRKEMIRQRFSRLSHKKQCHVQS
jgi:hypothetical protein